MKKILLALFAFTLIGLGWYLISGENSKAAEVKVAMVDYYDIENSLELSGEIVSNKTANISSLTGGLIKDLKISVGQKIASGDTLAVLDDLGAGKIINDLEKQETAAVAALSEKYSSNAIITPSLKEVLALAVYQSMELSSYNTAIKTLSDYEAQVAMAGNITAQSLDDIKADSMLPALSLADRLTLKQKADMAVIKSEVEGTVISINAAQGENILPGMTVLTIANTENLSVTCSVNENDLSKIVKGREVKLISRQDGKEFLGKITSISPAANDSNSIISPYAATGEAMCKITIKPEEGFSGMIGLGMEVIIPYESRSAVLSVPIDCLTQDGYVYVVNSGVAKKRKVETGVFDYYNAEVLTGLAFGEKVIFLNEEIQDNMQVKY